MWPFEPEGVILVRSQDTTVFYPLFQSSYSNFNNDKYNGASNTLIWLQLCYALFVSQIEVACFQHISWNIQIFAPVLHPSAAAQTPAEHRLPPSLCHIWDSLCPSPSPSDLYVTLLRWHACTTWPTAASMFHAAANECNEGHSQHMCPLSVWLCMHVRTTKTRCVKIYGTFTINVV